MTNVDKFHESYKSAKLLPHDGNDLVHEIAREIKLSVDWKISAIKASIGSIFYFVNVVIARYPFFFRNFSKVFFLSESEVIFI